MVAPLPRWPDLGQKNGAGRWPVQRRKRRARGARHRFEREIISGRLRAARVFPRQLRRGFRGFAGARGGRFSANIGGGGDADFVFAGETFDFGLLEDEGAAGFEGEGGEAGLGAGFERARADAGEVETQVVIFLGDFHGDRAAVFAGQFAAALEAAVGALETFDREDGAVFDDDELADFEAGNFAGDAEAELDVGGLCGCRARTELETGGGHEGLEPGRGRDELDAFFLQFLGDAAEEGVGVFFLEAEEESHRAQVGAEVEKIFRRDLAGHHALGDAAFAEGGDEFVELADFEPDEIIDERGERGVGFVVEGDGDEARDAQRAGLAREEEREGAVARDDAEDVRRVRHGAGR